MSEDFEKNLASYSLKSSNTIGRKYKENSPTLRTEFQRDRERIIHSTAFRRLEYKTQVFVNHEGDMYRTRLTHTIEVAQISRAVARALRINEDLTEAISLSHDLGHTPFGHAGQDILNEHMKNFGGFEHNIQSLRIVDKLENVYPNFSGLNLCFETREGILKKCNKAFAQKIGDVANRILNKEQSSLEAQVTNLCDEIAYNNHDIQDGIRAKKILLGQLEEVPIFKNQMGITLKHYPKLSKSKIVNEAVRRIINLLVTDLISNSEKNILEHNIKTPQDVKNCDKQIIGFSEKIKMENITLKRFLHKNLYQHPDVKIMTDRAVKVISDLFEAYLNDINLLPEEYLKYNLEKINNKSKERVVSDYIAGMTDRFALKEHEKLFGGN
tara:strand:- start:273 stop:1421 length:1149 start_codon:yes stop_codon:yes gene_type:complete